MLISEATSVDLSLRNFDFIRELDDSHYGYTFSLEDELDSSP